jgi:ABC-type sugar transport system ATPase subunit
VSAAISSSLVLLRIESPVMRFGQVIAVDRVELELQPGECSAYWDRTAQAKAR